MEIVSADATLARKFSAEIPALVWSTGPVAYEFQYRDYDFFEAFVRESWVRDGTLFAADATRLAVDGNELLGIEIGFHAPEFVERRAACGAFSAGLLKRGEATREQLEGLLERAAQAAWLNPIVRPGRYYIHALAVKPEHRGRKVGVALIENAMRRGREMGLRALELDVLSDNPAVRFYESRGLELYAETRAPGPQAFGVPPECRMGRML